jgi:hypothetical protein
LFQFLLRRGSVFARHIVPAKQVADVLARCTLAYDFGDVINELLQTTKGGFAVQQLS